MECPEVLAGKCKDIETEVLDTASDLFCDLDPSTANYIAAAALLKLVCIMNKIAQKLYPIGDVVPPEEQPESNHEYWIGCMPVDFSLCDVFSCRADLEGTSGGSGGSGGSGSGSPEPCDPFDIKWNIKITPIGEDPFYIFAGYVHQDTTCLQVLKHNEQVFSTEFENLDKVIPACSRMDVVTGDCSNGLGLRLDFYGFFPLDCQ